MERRGWIPGKGQSCHQMLEGGSDGSGGGAVKGWGQVPRTPPCPGGEKRTQGVGESQEPWVMASVGEAGGLTGAWGTEGLCTQEFKGRSFCYAGDCLLLGGKKVRRRDGAWPSDSSKQAGVRVHEEGLWHLGWTRKDKKAGQAEMGLGGQGPRGAA